MKTKSSVIILITAIILFACSGTEKQTDPDTTNDSEIFTKTNIKYAKGFSIKVFTDFTLIEVVNPWQGADNISFSYLLYKGNDVPKHNFNAVEIQIPIKNIVCMSTTHIGFLDKLKEIGSIAGIANIKLINNKHLQSRINRGLVVDIGYEQNVNYELLLEISPDLIMSYSIGSEITGLKNKLEEFGINLSINAEYLESHPLGKAEWIKFIAAFYDKLQMANELFDEIESDYLALNNLTRKIHERPTVLTGLPWKGTWYISGGQSYAAQLIKDAGAEFLWADNISHEAIGLSIESVYEIAHDAEFWINTGAAGSLIGIEESDERLISFRAWKNRKVFNNNAKVNTFGGNDYWESGLVNPQIILADLIRIFHPDLSVDSNLVYYKKLK
ncbi:MAG: ABC transporter substrate-binding protein [Bacteroidota bacterium]|nr:ABC transporter substrate-binding protein [Bacteroidota bacterium]